MPKRYTLSHHNADKHRLYQWSVQDADGEIELAIEQYGRRRGRRPRILREDFCGTALVSTHWVKSHPDRRAIGLDWDPAILDWAREHNVKPLGKDARRIELRQRDVRTVTSPKADVIMALNFSYFVFFPLDELVKYFRCVRRSLAPGGLFLLDVYGGWESQQVLCDRRTVKSPEGTFGYIWQQANYDPINSRTLCHIHFEFKNGKRWNKAFTYDWRLYTPAEVRDALMAAGLTDVEVLWDFDPDENTSDFRPARRAESSAGWIAYFVAQGNASCKNGKGSAHRRGSGRSKLSR